MPYLTPNTPPTSYKCRRIRIPDTTDWLEIVNGALAELTHEYNFEADGAITPAETAEFFTAMFMEYLEGTVCLIGAIIPYATDEVPSGCLPCDGSAYYRADYPRLFDVIAVQYRVEDIGFTTPDLRGRTVLGVGIGEGLTERAMGEVWGEETHAQTTAELNAHSHSIDDHTHTDSGHAHGYTYPTFNLDLEAPGVPDVLGAGNPPVPMTTSIGYASLDSVHLDVGANGSSEPMNVMQPSYALRYCIVAK